MKNLIRFIRVVDYIVKHNVPKKRAAKLIEKLIIKRQGEMKEDNPNKELSFKALGAARRYL